MQESSTDEEVSSLVLQGAAGGHSSLDSAQQQPLSPRDTQSDGGSSPFAEEMMVSRWGGVEEPCTVVANPPFWSIESRVQMMQYIQKIENNLEKLKVLCFCLHSSLFLYFLGFVLENNLEMFSSGEGGCAFFNLWLFPLEAFGGGTCGAICLHCTVGLQEASSSAAGRRCVCCFGFSLEPFFRDRTKVQLCNGGVSKGPLA